ncbi:hypothetical protein GCM10010269_62320 [Streptomyces humidus]|uniref:Uncharacterized protein n=1 Tax=Streptomyces humidus TaxID=52259 RepID=A0A918G1T0_9ACTN|nr:hypothetical protein GCM10010269_62320 [Streptomyces humidus]
MVAPVPAVSGPAEAGPVDTASVSRLRAAVADRVWRHDLIGFSLTVERPGWAGGTAGQRPEWGKLCGLQRRGRQTLIGPAGSLAAPVGLEVRG